MILTAKYYKHISMNFAAALRSTNCHLARERHHVEHGVPERTLSQQCPCWDQDVSHTLGYVQHVGDTVTTGP